MYKIKIPLKSTIYIKPCIFLNSFDPPWDIPIPILIPILATPWRCSQAWRSGRCCYEIGRVKMWIKSVPHWLMESVGCVGLGWVGLGWVGMGWVGLGWLVGWKLLLSLKGRKMSFIFSWKEVLPQVETFKRNNWELHQKSKCYCFQKLGNFWSSQKIGVSIILSVKLLWCFLFMP